ncbi:hypothetical protein U9M48_005416 [Paspalum notatum var. saurae]|uniref:GDSL esterase/lipase n=1 Tax=Paspalum notatum var. saurae TaxID=547442 RepID=A0AAQ3PWV7_PASNO
MAPLLPLLLLLAILPPGRHFAAAAEPPRSPATALFVLGDSTVGCAAPSSGGVLLMPPLNDLISSNLTGTTPPLPLPCVARRRLPDLLAERMGLPPPPPVSALNGTVAAAAARGVNFGGGAGFRAGAAVGQQVRVAAETLQLLRLEADDADVGGGAVFVLAFGSDACARLLAPGAAAAAPKHGRRGLARLLADRVARGVAELYEAGARRVAVLGVPPLGCAPRALWEAAPPAGAACVGEANELVQGYNARVAARLGELRAQLPGADVVFCDVYEGVMDIVSDPGRYGLEEAREACCGLGPFRATVGCLSKAMACGRPERRVWWDLYSTTEAVDALVVTWAWRPPEPDSSSTKSICSPISLQQLAAAGAGGV